MLLLREYQQIQDNNSIFIQYPDGQITSNIVLPAGDQSIQIIPGSFDPLHDGHKGIYWHCKNKLHLHNVYFEIAIERIGKPHLSYEDILARIKQFDWYAPVIITKATKFIDKINLFKLQQKKLGFHVGFDTAKRIIEQYPFDELESFDCTFYVYPRGFEGSVIYDVEDLERIPRNFVGTNSPPSFVSSTQLRAKL